MYFIKIYSFKIELIYTNTNRKYKLNIIKSF